MTSGLKSRSAMIDDEPDYDFLAPRRRVRIGAALVAAALAVLAAAALLVPAGGEPETQKPAAVRPEIAGPTPGSKPAQDAHAEARPVEPAAAPAPEPQPVMEPARATSVAAPTAAVDSAPARRAIKPSLRRARATRKPGGERRALIRELDF